MVPRPVVDSLLLAFFALMVAAAGNEAGIPADTATDGNATDEARKPREDYGSGPPDLLGFYQRCISPIKGGNTCAMHPSCSQYAKIAVERLGPIFGFAASCDRFVRCGRDVTNYPRVVADGAFRAYDPVERPSEDDDRAVFKGTASAPGAGAPKAGPLTPVAGMDSAVAKTADTTEGHCCFLADALMQRQQFALALLEYERMFLISPEPRCKRKSAMGLLNASNRIDDLDGFVGNFYMVVDSIGHDAELTAACGLLLARRYYGASRYHDALGALSTYVLTDSLPVLDKRHLLAALCRLSLYRTEAALAAADSIRPEGPLYKFTRALRREEKNFGAPERLPAAAGLLSMAIPGAGYLYAGRPATALASFVVNGLFFWTAYDFIAAKRYGAGATALVLGSGFYLGNIRGSMHAARAYNAKARKRKIALLLEGVTVNW
jgi:hypothetical protein